MKPDNLDQIYQMYVNDVYRYLYSLCLQHHTAEDLMQETFYRAYLYLENCKDEKVKPWLFRVAYNAFIDFKRKDSRSFTSESEFFDGIGDEETPEYRLLQKERWSEMGQVIMRLPEKQQQAILLHDFHQFSYQEAADILDVWLSYFKVLLFRARQKLREEKERMDRDEQGI